MQDGFNAGLNRYGKDMYIGRATYLGEMAPAKLLIESTADYNSGLFFPYGGFEYHLTNNIEYYAKESTCDYRWVKSSFGQRVEGAVQYDYNNITFYIGQSTEMGEKEVGKVVLLYKKMYFSHLGKEYERSFYDVLVCDEKLVSSEEEEDNGKDDCEKVIIGRSLVVLLITISYVFTRIYY